MKATEQYFPVVLFIILHKVVLTFESVDEILKCDHSNKSRGSVVSCGTVVEKKISLGSFRECKGHVRVSILFYHSVLF